MNTNFHNYKTHMISNTQTAAVKKSSEDNSFKKLEQAVLKNNPDADVEMLKSAFEFAQEVHKDQTRDEGTPYFAHPFRIAMYLAEDMNVGNDKVIAAALLHDTIEDGKNISRSVLEEKFGEEVARNVSLLTKKEKATGKVLSKVEYQKRLESAPKDVKRIKIADRLDNLRSLHLSPKKDKIPRYIEDTRANYLPMAKKDFATAAKQMEMIMRNLES